MTASGSESTGPPRRWRRGEAPVLIVAWSTRLVALITLLSVVRRQLRHPIAWLFDLPIGASVAATALATAGGVGLLMLATSLRRRKRRAWQITVLVSASIVVLH